MSILPITTATLSVFLGATLDEAKAIVISNIEKMLASVENAPLTESEKKIVEQITEIGGKASDANAKDLREIDRQVKILFSQLKQKFLARAAEERWFAPGSVQRDADGKLTEGKLAKQTEIQELPGVSLEAGTMLKYMGGRLTSVIFTNGRQLFGQYFNAGTEVKVSELYLAKGEELFKLGKNSEAVIILDEAVALDPADKKTFLVMGRALYATKDYEHARAAFNAAIALDGNYAYAYYCRSWTYSQLGDKAKALADYEKAMQIAPGLSNLPKPEILIEEVPAPEPAAAPAPEQEAPLPAPPVEPPIEASSVVPANQFSPPVGGLVNFSNTAVSLQLKQDEVVDILQTVNSFLNTKPQNTVMIITATGCSHCQKAIEENTYANFSKANPSLDMIWYHMNTGQVLTPNLLDSVLARRIASALTIPSFSWPMILVYENGALIQKVINGASLSDPPPSAPPQ